MPAAIMQPSISTENKLRIIMPVMPKWNNPYALQILVVKALIISCIGEASYS
jgi:hypothetical protein